jgi:hypothetical protein
MTHDEIENAFKTWGDPEAASRGKGKKFLGGHGNGGKFYMRQMFRESRFITYRNGKLNVFGFNSAKRYGFDKSYENRPICSTGSWIASRRRYMTQRPATRVSTPFFFTKR